MSNLKDFSQDINRCSKCGLCQSVCPVYKITGNDCAVSRGKFVMLDGVVKGDLKLNKNIEKYLDMCLKCGKCSNFCPSGINVCKIFEEAKHECTKNTLKGKFIFFIESKWIFGNFLKICKNIKKLIFPKLYEHKTYTNNNPLKLLYFRGCVNDIFPKTESGLKNILKNSPVEIIEKDFECCGLPFLSSGNLERFDEVKKHNLKLMNCDFDYILTDCASCQSTLKNYFSPNTSAPKFITAEELILTLNLKFKSPKSQKITYHKPCHLEKDDFLIPLIKNCENIEYIEMKNYDDCCGFAGEFALKNIKLSKKISNQKAKNISDSGADTVLTSCPACILGLKQGLCGKKNPPKIMNIIEFLNTLI